GAEAALDGLITAARKVALNPRTWQAYQMEIVTCLLRVVSEQTLEWDGLDGQLDSLMERILRDYPSVDDAQKAFRAVITTVLYAMEAHRQTSSRLLSANAEQYLQEHYMREDTSLEELCLYLHISPSYFSMIFKKETKRTFHQYLTDLRMDKALTLLSTTDMKIAQVAESVGLPDHSYFSYCFRRHFGYPPSRARSR
ncbi:MAG: helix-turn-helix transcriptional regulator, partial [Eubacteriales bacterium]|nr:helix-turn-helix transcriptional regulator [Eubacteriales bacterium]